MSTNATAANGQQTQPAPAPPANKQIAAMERNISDNVLSRIKQLQEIGEIVLPPNYVAENAIKAAWLVISNETVDRNGKSALEVCTPASVTTALYEMVVKGLSVVRKQCYFIVYGNKLELEESYMGKIHMAKRDANVKEVNPVTVYHGDEFEFQIDLENGGRKKVTKHEQKLENIDITKIRGAYAIITYNDGSMDTEIMTIDQIKKAWAQGAAKGDSPAHRNFTDQMAEKTVIQRALKLPVNTADDSNLERKEDAFSAGVKHDISTNANKEPLEITPHEEVEPETKKPEEQPPAAQETTPDSASQPNNPQSPKQGTLGGQPGF